MTTGSSCIGGHLNKTDYRLIRYQKLSLYPEKKLLIRQKCWTSKFFKKKNNTASSHIECMA
jgi:hypothetical protein